MTLMAELELVRAKKTYGYPPPVRKLTEFLILHAEYWPIVADYLREVLTSYNSGLREEKFKLLVKIHLPPGSRSSRDVGILWTMLEKLYSIASSRLEPRGRFLEFLIYQMGPFARPFRNCTCLRREYQCSLHERLDQNHTRSLVDSESTFDAAFLGAKRFEGHECKVRVRNFLSCDQPISTWKSDTLSKLDFMVKTARQAEARGFASRVFLTGLDEDCEPLRLCLQKYGFGDIGILGRDDLDELFA